MTDTNPFDLPPARVRLTEHDDGTTTATVRGRTHHGALETFDEIAGTFTVRADDDTDARIRRETWLIRHGLDPSYAGVASWVDSMIEKEERDMASLNYRREIATEVGAVVVSSAVEHDENHAAPRPLVTVWSEAVHHGVQISADEARALAESLTLAAEAATNLAKEDTP